MTTPDGGDDPLILVRRYLDHFDSGDFAALTALLHPEFELAPAPHWAAPPGLRYHGSEGFRTYLQLLGLAEVKRRFTVQLRRFGASVLATGTAWVETDDGPRSQKPVAWLFTTQANAIRRIGGYTDEQEALAALDPPPDAPVLTPRERQVFRLLADGLRGSEIAKALFVSEATVRTHVQNGRTALGARTRAQAIALALQRGELGPPAA